MPQTIRNLSLATCAVILLVACSAATSSPTSSPSAPAPISPAASASVPPGPTSAPEATPEPAVGTGVGHSIECDVEETKCAINRTDDAAGEAAGWPVTVDGPCHDLRTAPSGWAYVACSPVGGATIHVLDLDGRPVSGWPVHVDGSIASIAWHDFTIGCGADRSAIEVGSDGSAYVAVSTGPAVNLHVFNPDGGIRAGWPQQIPGDPPGQDGHGGDGCRGFALADDDGVVAWGYEDTLMEIQLAAGRTEFQSWSADGQVRPGWPRGSAGAASGPVLDADGGITYVSETGKVWSHDEAGQIRPGWPYILDRPAPPVMARDGRVAIIQEMDEERDSLVILGRDGQPISGGHTALYGDVQTVCIFGETPCGGFVLPVFADDGTLYVSLAPDSTDVGGSVIAFSSAGHGEIVDGWPINLERRTHVLGLSVDADGQLTARGLVCGDDICSAESAAWTTLVFAPDGTLVEQRNGD